MDSINADSIQVMDTNSSKYNDDTEEGNEGISNSIALADAQVAHTQMLVMLNLKAHEL